MRSDNKKNQAGAPEVPSTHEEKETTALSYESPVIQESPMQEVSSGQQESSDQSGHAVQDQQSPEQMEPKKEYREKTRQGRPRRSPNYTSGQSGQDYYRDKQQGYEPRHYQGQRQQQAPYHPAPAQQQSSSGYSNEYKRPPLNELSLNDLQLLARRLGIVGAQLMLKDVLIERIQFVEANPDAEIEVEGVLEKLPDGFGFLRSAQYDYVSGPDDIYVSPSQVRRFNLRTGDTIRGVIRKPKDGEKYFALLKVNSVNFQDPLTTGDRLHFDRLSALHPDKKFDLEYDPTIISTRIMDMFAPIGRGQRGLIVAPPKVGKTVLLKEIAQAIIANHPEVYVIVLLVDERPEEVTDMRRTVKGAHAEVVSSTFDESAARHVQVAEIVMEKAKRLVEVGQHVVILLDAITRLARAYNTIAPASGKVLTGGIDANALQRPKKFFGAARNTQEAGSLTIIASALIDTGSRMDEVIYEEFKGTGNSEIHMTRKLANRRVYPAFDLLVSGTRREELLQPEDDLNKVWILQKFLSTMNVIEGMEFLIDKIKKTKTNREFLDSINKKLSSGGTSSGSGSTN